MTYVPEPLDTSGVQIPAGIDALVEKLAEHIHDLWAVRRIQEGWRYGAERNDVKKTHPGLVPYGELSESEKEYDRETAVGALKVILSLGYEISPPMLGEG